MIKCNRVIHKDRTKGTIIKKLTNKLYLIKRDDRRVGKHRFCTDGGYIKYLLQAGDKPILNNNPLEND